MAFFFGDSFDLYAAIGDAWVGGTYWDSTSNAGANVALAAGRFSGSQALNYQSATSTALTKTSGSNDAVHHFTVGYQQTGSLSGTTAGFYIELFDGATAQCSIVFQNGGNIILTSGGPGGTTLATYTGAVAAASTWYGFEFEVVINNTTGSFAVRRNGNTVNDFSATGLNTRPTSTNNYANKITIGMGTAGITTQFVDDFLWRSDAASVPWVGDVRSYTRYPASDAAVAWSRLGGSTNYSQVSEAHQDGATSYVFSSTVSQSDLYGLSAISGTPTTVVGCVTRAFCQKSDAGTRNVQTQIKSGATTSSGASTALNTTWGWIYQTNLTDPATGAAWTAVGVNNATIGQVVTA